ncbi:MAG: F0F1 ATP synthase subunit A, partial [Desulfobacterales bacterium]|nr:F0F1 ATP synthase subunit A [Desulfobacterales bacterium]
MQDLGKVHQLIINLPGHQAAINLEVVLMSWIVFFILIVFGYLAARKRAMVPRPMQVLGELLVDQLYSLTEDALDK